MHPAVSCLMCGSHQRRSQLIHTTTAGDVICLHDNGAACCCSSAWCGASGETWRQLGDWRAGRTDRLTSWAGQLDDDLHETKQQGLSSFRLLYFTNQQPPMTTQPPTLSGTGNEYRPHCGDALRLGSKGRRGLFHLCGWQVKLWSLVNTCHTWSLCCSWVRLSKRGVSSSCALNTAKFHRFKSPQLLPWDTDYWWLGSCIWYGEDNLSMFLFSFT